MTRDEIQDLYCGDEPDILFADGYDEAILGTTWDGERTRVVYKVEDILNILMERDEMTYDDDVWDTVNSVDPDSFMQIKHGMDCYTDNCIMDVLPDIEEEESVL